ncbi:PQQ-binding-like beta-propeller repeat protein [Pseudonocardia sp.]|uniref:outer membrane protein assembly factor BamB family protein n=1 Tax=Pseudonocardia sp. TaxID=60912 RepID=UPI003D106BA8
MSHPEPISASGRRLVFVAAVIAALITACGTVPESPPATMPSSEISLDGESEATNQLQAGERHQLESRLDSGSVVSNGSRIATRSSDGSIVVLDMSGNPTLTITDSSRFAAECGLNMVRTADYTDQLLTLTIDATPAAGITPATNKAHLYATDARTGAALWDTVLPGSDGNATAYCAAKEYLSSLRTTSDGRWIVGTYPQEHATVIDSSTGQAKEIAGVIGVTGGALFASTYDGDEITFLDPATGAVTGTTDDPTLVRNRRTVAIPGTTRVLASDSLGRLTALELPSARSAWKVQIPPASSTTFNHADEVNGLVDIFMFDGGAPRATNGTVYAIDRVGRVVWRQPVSAVCGVMAGKVIVTVNFQLAILDGSSGEQLSYKSDVATCPQLLGNGYVLDGGEIERLF